MHSCICVHTQVHHSKTQCFPAPPEDFLIPFPSQYPALRNICYCHPLFLLVLSHSICILQHCICKIHPCNCLCLHFVTLLYSIPSMSVAQLMFSFLVDEHLCCFQFGYYKQCHNEHKSSWLVSMEPFYCYTHLEVEFLLCGICKCEEIGSFCY